ERRHQRHSLPLLTKIGPIVRIAVMQPEPAQLGIVVEIDERSKRRRYHVVRKLSHRRDRQEPVIGGSSDIGGLGGVEDLNPAIERRRGIGAVAGTTVPAKQQKMRLVEGVELALSGETHFLLLCRDGGAGYG